MDNDTDGTARMTVAKASRILLGIAAVLVVVWSFFDVARRAYQKNAAEHDRPITLTILHWGDRAEDVIDQNLADAYVAAHPRVKIVRVNVGYLDFRPKLKTMMAAGTPPDVFYLPPDIFPELAQQGLIRPIDDYIAAERASGKGAYLDDFWPVLMDAWHYDTATGIVGRGKLYGLPKDCTTSVMWVNLDLFQKAGVKVPYDGWTWDEYADAMRKIRALSGTPAVGGDTIYGGDLEIWPDSLRNILWSYGGEFFATKPDGTPDFTHVVLDQPPAQDAMQMIRRLRLDEKTVFNVTGGVDNNDRGFEQFLAGHIGCDGPVGRWKVPLLMTGTKFRWDCVPVPAKEPRLQASMIYLTAWSMSSGTKYPDECFQLIKFLSGPEGAAQQARAGLAIPPLISVSNSPDFLSPPGIPKHHAQIFLDALQHTHIPQQPREAEFWNRLVEQENARCLQLGTASTMEVARSIESQWLAMLASPLQRHAWGPMRWDWVLFATAAAVVAVTALLWWRAKRERLGPLDRAQERAGFAFILPWLVGFVALTFGPMIVSLLLSFTKWTGMTPMGTARAVGTANYRQLFVADPVFLQSLKVTFYYVLVSVPVCQAAALAVAVLLDTKVRGISIFRTIFFLPSVIAGGVAAATLWRQIFNNEFGLANGLLRPLLHPLGLTPPDWFGTDAHAWAIPAFVMMALWSVGSGMIIYLAALKGIPPSLYEAATIDGASPPRRFYSVSLPMLSPFIFYNVVMGIIGSFQLFTQPQIMTGGGPDNATMFYVLYLYRQAFDYHNMGYASALAWVLFVLVLLLTLLVFRASRNLVYYEGLKT